MSYDEEVGRLRAEISRLNQEILEKIRERVHVAVQIGEVKKKTARPVRDLAREITVLDKVAEMAETYGLDAEAARRVFREIIEMCVAAEEAL